MAKERIERIFFILNEIVDSRTHSVKTAKIRECCECSERQVRRDIETLKNMGYDIEYNPQKRAYLLDLQKISKKIPLLNNLNLCFALFYNFSQTLAGVNLLPFEKKVLENFISDFQLNHYAKYFRFEQTCYDLVKPEVFKCCYQAMTGGKKFEFCYINQNGKKSRRAVNPLQFYYYLNNWYLLAYDFKESEIRQFKLSRISEPEVSGERAVQCVADLELEDYIKKSFGIYKGKKIYQVKVRFYRKARNIVRHQVWHQQQNVREGRSARGKYLELELPVSSYEEICARILSFAPDAEAVSPREFRSYWKNCLLNTLSRYLPASAAIKNSVAGKRALQPGNA